MTSAVTIGVNRLGLLIIRSILIARFLEAEGEAVIPRVKLIEG